MRCVQIARGCQHTFIEASSQLGDLKVQLLGQTKIGLPVHVSLLLHWVVLGMMKCMLLPTFPFLQLNVKASHVRHVRLIHC